MTLILETGGMDRTTLVTIHQQLDGVPGRAGVPVVVERLDEHPGRTALAPLHIAMLLVRASAAMAVTLAIVGVYGTLTDATRRRRRELGLRIALGAQSWRIVALVLGQGGRLAAAGAGIGMLAAVFVQRALVRIAPSTTSPTVQIWVAGPLLLLGVVAVASVLPALRALTLDPLTVLRDDP